MPNQHIKIHFKGLCDWSNDGENSYKKYIKTVFLNSNNISPYCFGSNKCSLGQRENRNYSTSDLNSAYASQTTTIC